MLENQYRVGDVVKVGDAGGVVEDITLRTTVLRDLDGNVHHIPNGEIKKTTNYSKEFANVHMNVGVGYDTDLTHLETVINAVGAAMGSDANWKDKIIDPLKLLRVNDFGENAIEVKILGKTQPLEQWTVSGEFRKRLKVAFDREGIEFPYPQRVIHHVQQ